MKIAINRDWGGFPYPYDEYKRDDPALHALIAAEHPEGVVMIDIPDAATDWEINDYDGMETVIYVVDGMLYHAWK